MKESDVLSQLKELPPIIIDREAIQDIPKHKRVNYVLSNYLKGGDTIAKTSLLKYFVNSIVGVVETINTNPALRLYFGLLKSGMSILELNTIFNNIVRPVDSSNKEYFRRDDIIRHLILDTFGKPNESIVYIDLGREYDLLKDYIFDIGEDICNKNNLKILLREVIATENSSKKIIAFEYEGRVVSIVEESYRIYEDFIRNDELQVLINNNLDSNDKNAIVTNICHQLNELVLEIFYAKINPEINYVVIDNTGYHILTKKDVNEQILNVDYNGLVKSMNYCLNNGMKRGYILVGCPGVGKSLTIHKLANHFKKVPTFIIKNERLTSASDVKRVFDMIRPFKAITVIDDFDGLDVEDKNYITNEFLYQMDINGDYCGIVIAAINDPSKVNYTLMNRPGRFDEVHLMKIPSEQSEVLYVLENTLIKHGSSVSSLVMTPTDGELAKDFIKSCISNKFTHARISGVVEYCVCHFSEITLHALFESLHKLVEFGNNANLAFDGVELIQIRGKSDEIKNEGTVGISHKVTGFKKVLERKPYPDEIKSGISSYSKSDINMSEDSCAEAPLGYDSARR